MFHFTIRDLLWLTMAGSNYTGAQYSRPSRSAIAAGRLGLIVVSFVWCVSAGRINPS
jgi:hypothetical protein